jgi:hypothetical protein
MPRIHGGHTQLGSELNKNSQRTDHIDISRLNTKRAILYKTHKSQYVFYMKLLDNDGKIVSTTGPISLIGSPDDLASRYGSPKDMENAWEVLISYRGTSVNRGTAQVTRSVGTTAGGRTEEVEQSNQLLVKGTAFAPPGSGMA